MAKSKLNSGPLYAIRMLAPKTRFRVNFCGRKYANYETIFYEFNILPIRTWFVLRASFDSILRNGVAWAAHIITMLCAVENKIAGEYLHSQIIYFSTPKGNQTSVHHFGFFYWLFYFTESTRNDIEHVSSWLEYIWS